MGTCRKPGSSLAEWAEKGFRVTYQEVTADPKGRMIRKRIVIGVVALIALGLPVAWFGPGYYSRWHEERLLRHARALMAQNSTQEATIFLRRVLGLNHNNVEATRLMAEAAEKFLPLEAVGLREQVCKLVPSSYEDARQWALVALRFRLTAQADEALELMQKLGGSDAGFHDVAAQVALAQGNFTVAREQWAEAVRLEPANEDYQRDLATTDLRSVDPFQRTKAVSVLERLTASPGQRYAALRALIDAKLSAGRVSEALPLAEELVAAPDATFEDRLKLLSILSAFEQVAAELPLVRERSLSVGMLKDKPPATFASCLNDLEQRAASNAQDVADLINWMTNHNLSVAAANWASTLPPELIIKPPVAPNLAEAYRLTFQRDRLLAFISNGQWDNFEFMRIAFLARILRERGDQQGWVEKWAEAIRLTDFRPEKVVLLERATAVWNWPDEREQLLWAEVSNLPRPKPALEALAAYYRSRRNTQKLAEVLTKLVGIDPLNADARRSLALISLLQDNDRIHAGQTIHELFLKDGNDPANVTAYAFVLHLRDRDEEALALMQRLSKEQLRVPEIAAYYGVLLAANRKKDEAPAYFELAKQAVLLDKERDVVDAARRSLLR